MLVELQSANQVNGIVKGLMSLQKVLYFVYYFIIAVVPLAALYCNEHA